MLKRTVLFWGMATILFAQESQLELDAITVQGSSGRYTEPSDTFEPVEYLKSDTYVDDVPGQRQMSIEEALALPGVQGDPVKAVRYMAGVSGESTTSGEMIIHASKPRETITTLNHLPIGYLFHMGGMHSVIAPEATEQIDAYLGAFDVTYSNAMGGVLDITPKYPDGDGSGYVHMGLFDSSFGYDFALGEKTSAYVGGRRSYFDLTLPKTGELGDDVTYSIFPNYYDGSVIVSHVIDAHNFVSFESITAHDTLKINTQRNKEKDPLATGEVYADYGFTTTGLRWLYSDGDYSANTLFYSLLFTQKTTIFDDYRVDIKQDRYGLFHLSTLDRETHKLSFGFEADRLSVPLDLYVPIPPSGEDGTDTRLIDINDTVTGVKRTLEIDWVVLFLQDLYRFNDTLRLRYGVNYSTTGYQEFGSYADPRTALVWDVTPRDVLSFAYGYYTAFPDGVRTMKEFGSDRLGYERSVHYAVSYKHTFEDTSWLQVEPYYKSLFDLAVSDDGNSSGELYRSEGEGYAKGLDVTYSYRQDRLYLYGVYSYVDSRRKIAVNDGTLYPFYAEGLDRLDPGQIHQRPPLHPGHRDGACYAGDRRRDGLYADLRQDLFQTPARIFYPQS